MLVSSATTFGTLAIDSLVTKVGVAAAAVAVAAAAPKSCRPNEPVTSHPNHPRVAWLSPKFPFILQLVRLPLESLYG